MRLRNEMKTSTYMGYGEVGFTLQAGQTSEELSDELLKNTQLQKDKAMGLITVLLNDAEKSDAVVKTLAAVPPKPAEPPKSPPVSVPVTQSLDLIENDITAHLSRISGRDNKIAYLENLKKDGNGRAIKLANKLLKQFDVNPEAPAPVSPAPKLEIQQPVSNAEAAVDDKSAQISIGKEGQQPYAPVKPEVEGDDLDKLGPPALLSMIIRMGLDKDYNTQGPTHKVDVMKKLIRDHRAKTQAPA